MWNVCGHVLPGFELFQGSCVGQNRAEADLCLCNCPTMGEDCVSTSDCRLLSRCVSLQKKPPFLFFLSLVLVITAFSRISKKNPYKQHKGTTMPLFFQHVSKFLSIINQLLTIILVKNGIPVIFRKMAIFQSSFFVGM